MKEEFKAFKAEFKQQIEASDRRQTKMQKQSLITEFVQVSNIRVSPKNPKIQKPKIETTTDTEFEALLLEMDQINEILNNNE
jgi:DNA-binding response OmpR family regulator